MSECLDVGVWDVACAMAIAAMDVFHAVLACRSGHALNAFKTLCWTAKKNPRRRQGFRNICRGVTLFPLPAAVFLTHETCQRIPCTVRRGQLWVCLEPLRWLQQGRWFSRFSFQGIRDQGCQKDGLLIACGANGSVLTKQHPIQQD